MMSKSYRELCLSDKGHTCLNCGAKNDIEVHHIDGDHSNDNITNLVPLCNQCHQEIHYSRLEDGYLGELQEQLPENSIKHTDKNDTLIPVKEGTRKDLRIYKAEEGLTYDEAIQELMNNDE